MKNLILLILFVFSVKFCFADFDMNSNMRQAYSQIMTLDFELAQKTALYHQIGVWQLFKAGNGYNAHLYN